MSGTQLKRIFTYHPQMDGQSEVINRYMEQYLRCFVYQQPRQWSSLWATSPIILVYPMGSSLVDKVDHSLATRDALLKHLKKNLAIARNRMKQIADHGRRDVTFQEGDLVFLKLQPYRQQ
ncbi:hypothetical protein CK203_106694 [Vitis vinifera]|uniref:Integrase catalytic domain-containing protein n=1 Tax=Vitis vinifera TaxID=29760 RepID=A0A438DJU6_VITVI|nr:hypothetical protein CK203_106694 [Vitis vinifera]